MGIIYEVNRLDRQLKLAGIVFDGVRWPSRYVIDPDNQALADEVCAAFDTLVVDVDNPEITIAQSATIICNDLIISGDVQVLFNVWKDGILLTDGQIVAVVAGEAVEVFDPADFGNQTGTYVIEICREAINGYETGSVEIEVV